MLWLPQKSINFFPVNCFPLSVMIEFGHIEMGDDSKDEFDCFFGSDLSDRPNFNPFEEFVHHDEQVSETSWCHLEHPYQVQSPDHERPCYGYGL